MLLLDKVCLITGAGRGIGRAIATLFASEGAVVYANTKTPGSMDAWADEVGVLPLYFDVTDPVACKAALQRIQKEQGKVDVLVNNAGIMKDALIGMVTRPLVEEIFSVNVFAAMDMLQLAAKLMTRKKQGSIINLASIVGVHGNRGQLVYSASKGAVIAMTRTAAKELAPHNIRVNALAPGMIDTDMFRSIGEEHVQERLEHIDMGRLGVPGDVANACLFLASDLSAYVTGQILGVDGSAHV